MAVNLEDLKNQPWNEVEDFDAGIQVVDGDFQVVPFILRVQHTTVKHNEKGDEFLAQRLAENGEEGSGTGRVLTINFEGINEQTEEPRSVFGNLGDKYFIYGEDDEVGTRIRHVADKQFNTKNWYGGIVGRTIAGDSEGREFMRLRGAKDPRILDQTWDGVVALAGAYPTQNPQTKEYGVRYTLLKILGEAGKVDCSAMDPVAMAEELYPQVYPEHFKKGGYWFELEAEKSGTKTPTPPAANPKPPAAKTEAPKPPVTNGSAKPTTSTAAATTVAMKATAAPKAAASAPAAPAKTSGDPPEQVLDVVRELAGEHSELKAWQSASVTAIRALPEEFHGHLQWLISDAKNKHARLKKEHEESMAALLAG